jgi:ribosomal protein S6
MAQYELMLIIDPTVTDADRAETMSNLKALFDKNSVKIEKEDVW